MRAAAAKIGLALLLLADAASGAWRRAVAATIILRLRPTRAAWQAKGKMEFLWATPVMEYDGRDQCLVSRRSAVLRRLHAVDARRLQERRPWVVSFPILGRF